MQTEDRQTSSTFQPNIPQDPSRTPNLSADLFRSGPQAGFATYSTQKGEESIKYHTIRLAQYSWTIFVFSCFNIGRWLLFLDAL